MYQYVLRRILWTIPVLLAVSLITFTLMHVMLLVIPGGPCNPDNSPRPIPVAAQQACEKEYGLDKPLYFQYIQYIGNLLHGDLGVSTSDSRTVNTIIADDFPVSAAFGLGALIIGLGLGIPLGLYCALKRNSTLDRVCTSVVTLIIATPNFIFAILLIILFAVNLHVFYVLFARDRWQSWVLPLSLLAARIAAFMLRFIRGSVLDILNSDYIRTAHMKGLTNGVIYFRHVLRNALLPLFTLLGPLAADLLTGSFIVESIFGIPGLGRAFVTSIVARDYPLLMGVTLFYAVLLIAFNLLVDLSYQIIDPRITYG